MGAYRWIGLAVLFVVVGCAPRVHVKKNPQDHDKGIRYYRPKPFLFVTPSGVSETGSGSRPVTTAQPSDQFVSIELKYLPDFSEEYAINVSPGLGAARADIVLEDGWNLKSINQNLDSNFDENVRAIADLTRSIGGIVGTAGVGERVEKTTHIASNVAARNVPIGFYEAVIGRDSCGRKQLYGWRYIGFAPFAACPIRTSGDEVTCCIDGTLDLFGLVFENGVMTFRPLHQVGLIPDSQSSYRAGASPQGTAPQGTAGESLRSDLSSLAEELQSHLRRQLDDPDLAVYTRISNEGSKLLVISAESPKIVNELIGGFLVSRGFGQEFSVDIQAPFTASELPSP